MCLLMQYRIKIETAISAQTEQIRDLSDRLLEFHLLCRQNNKVAWR